MTVANEAAALQVFAALRQRPVYSFSLDFSERPNGSSTGGSAGASGAGGIQVPNPSGRIRPAAKAGAALATAGGTAAAAAHPLAAAGIEGIAFSVPVPQAAAVSAALAAGASPDLWPLPQALGYEEYVCAVYVPLRGCSAALWAALKALLEAPGALEGQGPTKVTFGLKAQIAALQKVAAGSCQGGGAAADAAAGSGACRGDERGGGVDGSAGGGWSAIQPAAPVLDVRIAAWVANPDAKHVPNLHEGSAGAPLTGFNTNCFVYLNHLVEFTSPCICSW